MKTSAIYEMPADKYNKQLAESLKQIPEFKEPEWVAFVKTGMAKKRPPQEKDFWYKRAASILRQIYVNRVVGVNRLRTRYGSKKNRGFKPERFKKAGGKIIRTILQQAETAGLLEKYNESGKRAGRKLTEKGKEFLENIKLSDKTKEESKPITINNSPKQEGEQKEEEDNEKQKATKEISSEQPVEDIKEDKINKEEK